MHIRFFRRWIIAVTLGETLGFTIAAVVGGTLASAVLQWAVLRRSIRPASFWIPANMAGWAVGILWTLAPSPVIDETTPFWAILALFAIAGLLMAVTVATITAFAARMVVRSARPRGEHHEIAPV